MANKAYCDVCGKEAPVNTRHIQNAREYGATTECFTYDICDECYKRITTAAYIGAKTEIQKIKEEMVLEIICKLGTPEGMIRDV